MTENKNILIVDDEANILYAFKRQLRTKYKLDVACGPLEALDLLNEGNKYAVIISDMMMPDMNGVAFLKEVKRKSPNTVRIMLTGNADQNTAVSAVNDSSIFRFLNKPCSMEDLCKAIDDGLVQYRLVMAEKELLQNTLSGSVKMLTDLLSMLNPDAFGNSLNYRKPIREIATALNLSSSWDIELTMMLAEIGAFMVPDDIIDKYRQGEELKAKELELVQRIPETGRKLLSNIPRLEKVAEAVFYSQKNYDGSGFPFDEVRGKNISQIARIVKVLRDFDRAKLKLKSSSAALAELTNNSNLYDPDILEIITELFAPAKTITEAEPEENKFYEVTFKQLCPGQMILADVKTNDGILLLKTGSIISETMIEKIKNYETTVGLQGHILVDCLIPTIDK